MNWKRYLSLALRFGLGAAGLLYAFWGVDFAKLTAVAADYNWFAVLAIVAFSFGVYVYLGYRLAVIAHWRSDVRVGALATVICHGFNNILPTKLGELAKAIYLSARGRLTKAEALGVVFWERFLDLNAILLLALLAMALMERNLFAVPLAAAIGGLWSALFVFRRWPAVPERLISWLPAERLRAFARELQSHVDTRFKARFLLRTAGQTGVVWLLYSVQALLILLWVAALDITFAQALVVFVVSGIGMSLPSTPGALGVFEAAVVLALSWYGVPKEQAIPAALVMHMIEYIPTTGLTLLMLMRSDLGLGELRTALQRRNTE